MLTYLTARFFIRNRRRTLRAVIMLSIGISLVLSTDMLMSGFILQIKEFASLLEKTGSIVTINPTNGQYTNQEIQNLVTDLEKNNFHDNLLMGSEVIDISYANQSVSAQISRANMTKLVEWNWINYEDTGQNNTLYISDISGFSANKTLFSNDFVINANLSKYEAVNQFTSDIVMPLDYNLTSPNIVLDQVYVKLPPGANLDLLENIVHHHASRLVYGLASTTFLEITANQITRVLIILQLAMSFLLILSITYVMLTLVYDSKDDLRIFHMLGLSRSSIFMIFLGQSILASLVAIGVSVVFSVLFLQAVLPLMTYWLPYGVIVINPDFVVITAFQSIFVGVVSGLYPAKVGADYYG